MARNNAGKDHQIIAIGEDARRIFSLSFAHDGVTIFYAAEHDDRYDIHALDLKTADEAGGTRSAQPATLDSDPAGIGSVVADEFSDGRVAYSAGSCDGDTVTKVWVDGEISQLGGDLERSAQPSGWLPNGDLLVLARPSGCGGEATLYSWNLEKTTRLASGVSGAGTRAVLPPPPAPPDAEQDAFA